MDSSTQKSGVLIFFGVLLAILAFGVGVRAFMLRDNSIANADKVANSQNVALDPNAPYNKTEVAKHNRPTNCWTIVNDGVYNITKLIKENQDIAVFTTACGVDGSAIFNGQQFTTGELIGEDQRAMQAADQILPKYKVGKFKP